MSTFAKINGANMAMCFALRNPPRGQKPTKLSDIQKLVRKTDGKRPTLQAIQQAASTFKDKKVGSAGCFNLFYIFLDSGSSKKTMTDLSHTNFLIRIYMAYSRSESIL